MREDPRQDSDRQEAGESESEVESAYRWMLAKERPGKLPETVLVSMTARTFRRSRHNLDASANAALSFVREGREEGCEGVVRDATEGVFKLAIAPDRIDVRPEGQLTNPDAMAGRPLFFGDRFQPALRILCENLGLDDGTKLRREAHRETEGFVIAADFETEGKTMGIGLMDD